MQIHAVDNRESLGSEKLIELINSLEEAKESHNRWLWAIHRLLLCEVASEGGIELDPSQCGFSRWLKSVADHPLVQDEKQYALVKQQHMLMHTAAARLLEQAKNGHPLPVAVYDAFIEQRHQFKREVEILERQFWDMACLLDPLTGLRNRHGMLLELREEQQRALREQDSCVIAMMDVDHFKRVNDEHGHKVGDEVLQTLATLVTSRLRPYDRLYRYGGEEFLICLPGTRLDEAGRIFERLRHDIAANPFRLKEVTISLTVSFGLALIANNQPVEIFIERADQALYEAKSAGRNCVRIYEEDPMA